MLPIAVQHNVSTFRALAQTWWMLPTQTVRILQRNIPRNSVIAPVPAQMLVSDIAPA